MVESPTDGLKGLNKGRIQARKNAKEFMSKMTKQTVEIVRNFHGSLHSYAVVVWDNKGMSSEKRF